MRVLFWCELFRPDIGGLEIFGEQLIRRLEKKGFEFAVVTSRRGLVAPERETFEGIELHRYPFQQALQERDLPAAHRITSHLLEFLRAWKPDLIHLNTCGPSLFYFERCVEKLRIPALFTLHSPVPDISKSNSLLGRALLACQAVNAVSQNMLDCALKFCPEIAGRSSVILNGLEEPAEAPTPLSFAPPRILGLGRMVKDKGFDIAIDAFALLRKRCPAARLVLAGDGPERAALEQQAVQLGLEDSVEFRGWVSPEAVPSIINAATSVIMPSRYPEPFGLVAVQAGQMARPIVASRAGGLPEIVLDGETGMLVNQEDPVEMADALFRLISDPPGATKMGAQARSHVLRAFDITRMTREYEALYCRLGACGKAS